MNWFASYFHTSRQYQTFGGDLLRFRTFGGGLSVQYPFDKFTRVDGGLNWIGIARDYDAVAHLEASTHMELLKQVTLRALLISTMSFTKDATLPGFITPQGGIRYTLSLSGALVLVQMPQASPRLWATFVATLILVITTPYYE